MLSLGAAHRYAEWKCVDPPSLDGFVGSMTFQQGGKGSYCLEWYLLRTVCEDNFFCFQRFIGGPSWGGAW
jgi:hypothetical protein